MSESKAQTKKIPLATKLKVPDIIEVGAPMIGQNVSTKMRFLGA
jgi:hypothetical protein